MSPKTFQAEDCFHIRERGDVYVGRSPIDCEPFRALASFGGEWKIEHPSATGKVFQVAAVEVMGLRGIRQGDTVGLLVKELPSATEGA